MPFFQREPFTSAEAFYVWAGVQEPGFIQVAVQGDAPKFSSGFQLKQDFSGGGGLIVEVMG